MPASDDDPLDAIAAELYAVPPDGFTAARNARAADVGADLRPRVKALRKPVVSAWAVDLLVRQGALAEAMELAAALREAQEELDAEELAALGRQRRALVAALAGQAVDAAAAEGVTVSAAAREDVEKTLNAAMMDAAASAAVMSGRLVKPLVAGGYEPADLADAVGGSVPGAAAPPPRRDDLAERRARKAAEKAAREADRAAGEAQRELARIEARREKSRERVDHLRERVADLTRDLARLTEEAAAAEAELDRWEEERREAASRAKDAAAAAERARRAVPDA